jgi:hypothetical protein
MLRGSDKEDAMTPSGHEPAPSYWTTAYWLRKCEGYQVFDHGAPGAPIGYVEAVLDDEGGDHTLLVRVGERFTHLVAFPAESVDAIDPVLKRVYVALMAPTAGQQLAIPALA